MLKLKVSFKKETNWTSANGRRNRAVLRRVVLC